MDEPESMAGLSIAARENLDNLIFVVNCNLQRLDGPVRGNHKVIQELEMMFRGAGWNVIKVIWGRAWNELLARDVDGVLVNKMNSTVDGEFQKYATESGAYIREHFSSGPILGCRRWWSSTERRGPGAPPRGGHDYRKLYAAHQAGHRERGQPHVIRQDGQGLDAGPS
jgi:pyruvate dehydrogenase E1 component